MSTTFQAQEFKEIPKAQFHIGDKVMVRCEEAGYQDFLAVVAAINFNPYGAIDYTVMEPNGMKTDGYSDDWLTAATEEKPKEPTAEEAGGALLPILHEMVRKFVQGPHLTSSQREGIYQQAVIDIAAAMRLDSAPTSSQTSDV